MEKVILEERESDGAWGHEDGFKHLALFFQSLPVGSGQCWHICGMAVAGGFCSFPPSSIPFVTDGGTATGKPQVSHTSPPHPAPQ